MGARGLREVPEDEWTLVAEAVSSIFDRREHRVLLSNRAVAILREIERRIQRAWRDPSFRFRGIPHAIPRTREPVEIPFANRRLVLDCRALGGRENPDFGTMNSSKCERRISSGWRSRRAPSPQPTRAAKTVAAPNQRTYYSIVRGRVVPTAPDVPAVATNVVVIPARKPPARKAGKKAKRVADVMLNEWLERPDITVTEMLTFVLTKIKPLHKRTVEVAIRWLEDQGKWAARQTRPARQTRSVRQFPS